MDFFVLRIKRRVAASAGACAAWPTPSSPPRTSSGRPACSGPAHRAFAPGSHTLRIEGRQGGDACARLQATPPGAAATGRPGAPPGGGEALNPRQGAIRLRAAAPCGPGHAPARRTPVTAVGLGQGREEVVVCGVWLPNRGDDDGGALVVDPPQRPPELRVRGRGRAGSGGGARLCPRMPCRARPQTPKPWGARTADFERMW